MRPEALSVEYEGIWSDLPSVSVIVLNYNTVQYLRDCFRSLQQLIYPEDRLELILVDNASTDQSLAHVRDNWPAVKRISNDQNYGFSQGNNIGAERATGRFIAFLNPDMRVDKRWLIELVKPLLADSDIAVVGSRILSWDGQTVDFGGGAANFYGYGYQTDFGRPATENVAGLKPILFACGGAMLIQRRIFLEAGGFDEDFFAYYEDLDLGWRLWVLGYKVALAPLSVTYHVHHGAWGKVNQEKKRVLYERNAFFAVLKNYHEEHLNKILPVALMLLMKRIYLALGIDEALFALENRGAHQKTGGAPVASQEESSGYGARYYLKTAWRTLLDEGLVALYRKGKAELKLRRLAWRRRRPPGKSRVRENGAGEAIVPLQALSYAVAGNDVITLYEKMLTKRQAIQSRRRRSDQEIFALFERPLDVSERWPEYKQTQLYLTRLFEIDKMFKEVPRK